MLLLSLLTGSAFAQSATTGAVRGVVTDADGQPAAGVVVQARKAGRSGWLREVETDASGAYLLGWLPAGYHWLDVVGKPGARVRVLILPEQYATTDLSLKRPEHWPSYLHPANYGVPPVNTVHADQGLVLRQDELAVLPF